jgi:hypothetical protein
MANIKVLTSALPPLVPESVIDLGTGEVIEIKDFEKTLAQLVAFVQQESTRLWAENKATLKDKLETITAKSPAEVGRQAGMTIDLEMLPREVKAKSRIERLVRYQLVTSAKSYFESPVLTKQEPTFSSYLNLGAVDAQMVVLTQVDDKLELLFKCWEQEFLLTFSIPAYILERNVTKFTLPVVRPLGEGWGFLFTVQEQPQEPVIPTRYVMGVDLGRVEPYTLIVADSKTGKRVAQYTATPRLRVLLAKRDRLNIELGYMSVKANAHKQLGLPQKQVLQVERERTRSKRNRLLNKITWLIAVEIDKATARWSPQHVAMENLNWVNPKHGMSRWTHSKDQQAITHKLSRRGVRVMKVNARNTSQECHKCGEQVTHKPGKRLIVCSGCSLTCDRDINASMNITFRPLRKRSKGNSLTSTEDAMVNNHPMKRLLTRNTS